MEEAVGASVEVGGEMVLLVSVVGSRSSSSVDTASSSFEGVVRSYNTVVVRSVVGEAVGLERRMKLNMVCAVHHSSLDNSCLEPNVRSATRCVLL